MLAAASLPCCRKPRDACLANRRGQAEIGTTFLIAEFQRCSGIIKFDTDLPDESRT
jgi:hypothetical protein